MALSRRNRALALSFSLAVACSSLEKAQISGAAPVENEAPMAELAPEQAGSNADARGALGGAPGSAPAAAPPPVAQRQLIRTVALALEVDAIPEARKRAEALVQTTQGFVEGLSSTEFDQVQHLQMTLRVPSARLDEALGQLRKLGRVERESQQVEDVTRKLVDVEARRRNILRTEQRLLALLDRKESGLADVLSVERELSRVREEAEVLDAELRTLGDQVALSKVDLSLTHDLDQSVFARLWTPWSRLFRDAGEIMADSVAGLIAFGAALARAALYALPWTPVVVLAWFGVRALRRRRAQRAQ